MGDIAEMMLDGTLCEGCGDFMGNEGEGFLRYCSPECAHDRGMDYEEEEEEEEKTPKKKIKKKRR